MQYFLCPRCSFKVPGNRRNCPTCGYEVPKAASNTAADAEPKNLSKKSSVWARFLGLGQHDGKPGEGGQEKPALG